jgi:hypothetical protein
MLREGNTVAAHPRLVLHLRVFVVMGVPFGVLLAAWNVLQGTSSPRSIVVGGVVAGAVFGAVMSALLGTVQWHAAMADRDRRREGDPDATLELGPTVSRIVTIDAPSADVLRRAARASSVLGGRVVGSDARHVTLSVPTSWRSWGERVTVAAGPGDAVTISSRPVLRATVVDGGRNARNVEELAAWLGARR